MTEIGWLPGGGTPPGESTGQSSYAYAISNANQAVGTSASSDGYRALSTGLAPEAWSTWEPCPAAREEVMPLTSIRPPGTS